MAEAVAGGAGLVVLPENFSFMGEHEKDLLALRESDGEGPLQDAPQRQPSVMVSGWSAEPYPLRRKVTARSVPPVWSIMTRASGLRVTIRYICSMSIWWKRANVTRIRDYRTGGGQWWSTPRSESRVSRSADLRFPELFRKLLDKGMEVACLLPLSPLLQEKPTGRLWCRPGRSRI